MRRSYILSCVVFLLILLILLLPRRSCNELYEDPTPAPPGPVMLTEDIEVVVLNNHNSIFGGTNDPIVMSIPRVLCFGSPINYDTEIVFEAHNVHLDPYVKAKSKTMEDDKWAIPNLSYLLGTWKCGSWSYTWTSTLVTMVSPTGYTATDTVRENQLWNVLVKNENPNEYYWLQRQFFRIDDSTMVSVQKQLNYTYDDDTGSIKCMVWRKST